MAMSKISTAILKSRFRGCMLGSLAGNCCGAPFEGDTFSTGEKLVLQKYFDTLEGPYFKAPVKKHTEDSSMTKCVAQCLIDRPEQLDAGSLAKALAKEFFNDPSRGYAENTVVVFNKLRANKFADPFQPAREPANFASSSDNGAAIRSAPVAMMYCNDYERMVDVARQSAEITHTHKEGVVGALLMCAAVRQSLLSEPDQPLDVLNYTDQLMERLVTLERDEEGLGIGDAAPYTRQLQAVRALLTDGVVASDEQVLNQLGHSNRALFSVPTAIYCFLRSNSPIEEVQTRNPLRRALQFAISLGGDTDSIAAMTGGVAGAYHGQELLSESLLRHCEAAPLFSRLADGLFESSTAP